MPHKLRYSLVVWLVAIGLFSFLFLPPILIKMAKADVDDDIRHYEYETLWVNDFDSSKATGTANPPSPYLNDSRSNWVKASRQVEGGNYGFAWFHFENTSYAFSEIQYIMLFVECHQDGYDFPSNSTINPLNYDGGGQAWNDLDFVPSLSWEWKSFNLTAINYEYLNSIQEINSFKFEFVIRDSKNAWMGGTGAGVRVTKVYLLVVSTHLIDKSLPDVPLDAYIKIGYGLGSLGVLAFLPLFLIMMYRRKKEKFWSWIPWAICLFFIAIGCLVGWLYE